MKKIIIGIYLISSVFALQSCLFEEQSLFDQSAIERLKITNEKCKEILVSAPYGWKMAYDSNDKSCTRFFVKFKIDGTVIMTSDISTTATLEPDTSRYEFKMSQGPVLAFNTYNKYFHSLSNPDGNNSTKGGDNDFVIMSATPDSVVLKGIKGQTYVSLYKANEGDEAGYYVNNTRFKNFFKKSSSSPFFTSLLFADGSGVSMVTESNTRYITFIYQDEQGQTIHNRVSYDYNAQGFNTWNEIKTKGKTFSNFVWDSAALNFYPTIDPTAKFIFTHTTPFPYDKTVEKNKGNSFVMTNYSAWFKTNVFDQFKSANSYGLNYKGVELLWEVNGKSSFSFLISSGTADPENIFNISQYTTLRDDQVAFQNAGTFEGVNAAKLNNNFYFKKFLSTFFATNGFTVYNEDVYMYLISIDDSTKWLCFKRIEE